MMNRLLKISIALFTFSFATTLSAQQNVELVNSGEIMLTADLYNALGHYSKAENLYLKVGRNDTNYAEVLRDLAYTYNMDKEDSLCLATARKGKELESEFKADFYIYMGISLKELEKYDTAIKVFDEGIRFFPYKYSLQYWKGMTYFKMKKYPEAELCFQKAIELNPYHAHSHFQLGKCCAEQGRIVPAILSWQYFLMMENNSERSQKVVSSLEDIYSGDNQADPDFQLTAHEAGDDCFNDIVELVNSKAPFAPGYKNKTKIELKMVKMFQAILEKLHYEPNTGNFWMENYVPFFVELQKKNYLIPYESFALYSVGDNPSVAKSAKKNKKKIHEFALWAGKYIDMHNNHPARLEYGKDEKVQVTFYENHIINGVGPINDLELENGQWKYFYARSGHLFSKGEYKNGKREGEWLWYYDDGTIKEKSNFKNGLREGESEVFYENGLHSYTCSYKNGALEGSYTAYEISGYKTQSATMVNGKLEGTATAYYEDGTKKAEINYLAGKLSGELTLYTIDGKLSKKLNYLLGMRNGNSKEYYSDGKLKSEGDYKNDEAFGPWKVYYDNGKTFREGVFKDKGLRNGLWTEYYRNGELSVKAMYTLGKLNGVSSYYDTDGKIYAEKKYASDKLKSEKYFSKDGTVLAEYNMSNDFEVTEYYPNGERAAKGRYYNGMRTGDWKMYSENGSWLSAKEHYYNGYLSGTRTEYFENGEEASEVDYHYGDRDGYLKVFFLDGTLRTEGWYVRGYKQGDWFEYNQRGLMQSHRYFIDGELHGVQEYFDEKGKKDEETFFKNLNVWTRTRFDSTGSVIYKYESENGNGLYDFKYSNGQTLVRQEYKGGTLNGKTERYLMNGTKTIETTFRNGDQHGSRKEFFRETGKPSLEAEYAYNNRHGAVILYWENGAKRSEENYYAGELDGPQKYYYENGTLKKEGTWDRGNANGELKSYSDDGSLTIIRYYKYGNILGYSYLDKDGKPVAMIPFESASGKFTAYYQNGNKSIEGEYVNGRMDGNVIEYFPNGKMYASENYKNGNRQGMQKYYFKNDSLKSELSYYGDEEDGAAKYYYDNGKVEHTEYRVLGDDFGTWVFYNKDGIELKRIQYYDDRQVNVILSVPSPVPSTKPKAKPKTK
jgi:antitoxin component YwqK of YwqJK toxin-antitoxin module